MELFMELPSPKIGSSMDLELGLENSFFTDSIDDLSRQVSTPTPTPTPSTCVQHKVNIDAGSSSQLRWYTPTSGASEIDYTQMPSNHGSTSSKHPKMDSWNISFGHPHSFAEWPTPSSTCDHNRKRSAARKQKEQELADEDMLAYMENELGQNIETSQTSMYQSNINDLQGFEKKGSCLSSMTAGSTLKMGLDSPSSRILKGDHFSVNHHVTDSLSKNGAHIMAERKRREKLNQKFIALSAIVPGLKKADKATILADAAKYVKRLEEQLKVLEDQQVPNTANFAPRSQKSKEGSQNCAPSAAQKKDEVEGLRKPDIEAQVVGKNALIRVHCGKTESILVKVLEELENLNLSVVNANVLSFSNKAVDLTFTAQIEEDSKLTAEDIVKALRSFFEALK